MFWRYSGDSTSQVAAISNDCLNPILDSNTIDNAVGVGNCGGTISQQDESGQASAPITSPTIEALRFTDAQTLLERIGTLHEERLVIFDNDTRLLFATIFDGDWELGTSTTFCVLSGQTG